MEITLASNKGPRLEQEDTVAVREHHGYILLLVADGVGGQTNGNEASYITASKIQKWFGSLKRKQLDDLNENNIKIYLTKIINEMKDSFFPRNGGTTLNMSIIGPQKTIIINIGDSRAYRIKDNEISLITKDNSHAFRELNPQTKEERDNIRYYRFNNIITNCIEMKSIAKINIYSINNGDYDILCHMTDGVSDILTEDKIKECCLSKKPAKTLVEKSVSSLPEYQNQNNPDFTNCIEPHDNASAVVYTKKRTKNGH